MLPKFKMMAAKPEVILAKLLNQSVNQSINQQNASARRIGLSGKRGGSYKYVQQPDPRSLYKGNISITHCMPLSTRLQGSRMKSPPGFQIQLRPPVTLTFDLLPPEFARSCHWLGGRFMPLCIEIGFVGSCQSATTSEIVKRCWSRV